jgi:electron transport complex protein RnfA
MIDSELWALLLNAALVNNFVLAYFLGICPFLGVSGQLDSAGRMGLAVTFVMLVASLCAFGIHRLLVAIGTEYLSLISYIVVIAAAVQLVEMFVRKTSPGLFRALGIYLPLITTNCAVLAVALFQTQRGYGLLAGLVFALGAGLGFTLALVLMAGIRERLRLVDVPDLAQGTAITLVLAGILSLAFGGFAGIGAAP